MSGHSKQTATEHKKVAIDVKRGKLFAHLVKNIEAAARTGDDDSTGNPTLFDTIQKVRKNSVPADNIMRVVRRGSRAEASGANYETIIYEDYGPGDATFYVECLTDNRSRTVFDVRLAFVCSSDPMVDPGSVTFLFSRCGTVGVVAAEGANEDSTMEAALEAGTEKVEDLEGGFVVESDPSDVIEVHKVLQAAGIDYDSAEVQFVAATKVEFDFKGAVRVQRLANVLEDPDDVQSTYHDMTVLDEVRVQLEKEE